MTAAERVMFTSPCPTCAGDAEWWGTRSGVGEGTEYRIVCAGCDPVGAGLDAARADGGLPPSVVSRTVAALGRGRSPVAVSVSPLAVLAAQARALVQAAGRWAS